LSDAVIEKLAPELVRAALEVSKKLGFDSAT
jgi:hypothetical protein